MSGTLPRNARKPCRTTAWSSTMQMRTESGIGLAQRKHDLDTGPRMARDLELASSALDALPHAGQPQAAGSRRLARKAPPIVGHHQPGLSRLDSERDGHLARPRVAADVGQPLLHDSEHHLLDAAVDGRGGLQLARDPNACLVLEGHD